jgi:hypothetical protein
MARTALFLLLIFVVPLPANAVLTTDGHASAAAFGIIENSVDGKPTFVRTNRVPLVENQKYGWVIRVPKNLKTVRWREEFTLPAPPNTWGEGEKDGIHAISADRRVSTTEREVPVRDGIVSNFWRVASGDPTGKYVIRVFINDALVETFHFEAVKPNRPDKSIP